MLIENGYVSALAAIADPRYFYLSEPDLRTLIDRCDTSRDMETVIQIIVKYEYPSLLGLVLRDETNI